MKLISLKCPDCGANLEIDPERSFCFCQYCGHKILVDDEIKRSEVTYTVRDEARILEAEATISEIELEREWQTNRKKSINRWFKFWLSTLIIGAMLFGFGAIVNGLESFGNKWYDWVAIISFEIGMIVLLYGGLGYFISLLSHNRQRRKRKR